MTTVEESSVTVVVPQPVNAAEASSNIAARAALIRLPIFVMIDLPFVRNVCVV